MERSILMLGAGFVALQFLAVMVTLAAAKRRSADGHSAVEFDGKSHSGAVTNEEGEDSTLSSELALRTTITQGSDGVATLG